MNPTFIKNLIKGKIAEIIFEQMFRESGRYTILRSGYEYTLPELAQFGHLAEVKAVMENIRNAPDFILISQDHTEVHLVEIKYRAHRDAHELLTITNDTLKTWNPAWLFIASPDGFFFEPCNTISHNHGKIGPLYEKWVSKELQREYLKMLNEFELAG